MACGSFHKTSREGKTTGQTQVSSRPGATQGARALLETSEGHILAKLIAARTYRAWDMLARD